MPVWTRIVEPAAEPAGLSEAKAFLRVSHAEDDVLIGRLIRAARERVESLAGRALLDQVWRMTAEPSEGRRRGEWASFEIPARPATALVSARLLKADGTSAALAAGAAELDEEAGEIRLKRVALAGAGLRGFRPVEAVVRCGALAIESVPAGLRTATLALVAQAYERRGAPEAPDAAEPEAVAAALAPFLRARL